MAEVWNNFVGILQTFLLLLTQLSGGNLGFAIVALSCSVRFALLPLTLRIAQRMELRQRKVQALQPQLDHLKARYADQPDRLARETFKLYRDHGVGFFDATSIGGTLLQMPFMAGLYSAISRGLGSGRAFLWIRDLAQPDILLGVIIGLLTFGMTALAPGLQPQTKLIMLIMPAIITFAIVFQMSSGLGLYWTASNGVGLVQSLILRRSASRR
jgi:YidC/Oxa1 family membrane protein insertase